MSKSDKIQVEGCVMEVLPKQIFRVELANGHQLQAHLSEELRMNFTKLLPAHKIMLEIHPYDLSQGRIVGKQ